MSHSRSKSTRSIGALAKPKPLANPVDARSARAFAERLLAWYRAHRRDLPWRATRDPYAVWVSEMMLQQTQVATVRGYYERWMKRFPTVEALARADEADVLVAWQGLGYYSRAKNLRRGARAVVERYGGRVPASVVELRALPGIGPYSAGAIASIAHGVPTPIVDGNVVRVLCRFFGLRGDPARAPLRARLWALSEALVPEHAPGDFNQGLMELGATVCVPRAPKCAECPLAPSCIARIQGTALELPEAAPRPAVTKVPRAAAVVRRGDRVLVVQVPEHAPRWSGMWQFPNTDVSPNETAQGAAVRAVKDAVGLRAASGERLFSVQHSVTRYRITLDVFACAAPSGAPKPCGVAAFVWKRPEALEDLAMPAAHRRIARALE